MKQEDNYDRDSLEGLAQSYRTNPTKENRIQLGDALENALGRYNSGIREVFRGEGVEMDQFDTLAFLPRRAPKLAKEPQYPDLETLIDYAVGDKSVGIIPSFEEVRETLRGKVA